MRLPQLTVRPQLLRRLTAQLKQDGQLTDQDLEVFEKEIAAEIAQAIDAAEAAGNEPLEDLTKFVYSPRPT